MDYRACTRQVPEDHFALEGDGGVEGWWLTRDFEVA
jgi:hypothetical protein